MPLCDVDSYIGGVSRYSIFVCAQPYSATLCAVPFLLPIPQGRWDRQLRDMPKTKIRELRFATLWKRGNFGKPIQEGVPGLQRGPKAKLAWPTYSIFRDGCKLPAMIRLTGGHYQKRTSPSLPKHSLLSRLDLPPLYARDQQSEERLPSAASRRAREKVAAPPRLALHTLR
jgi:hypothetical protein